MMPGSKSKLKISPTEMAKMLGKTNPATIQQALRNHTYPIGMAYQTESGRWVYDVPREPFIKFIKTGRVPE